MHGDERRSCWRAGGGAVGLKSLRNLAFAGLLFLGLCLSLLMTPLYSRIRAYAEVETPHAPPPTTDRLVAPALPVKLPPQPDLPVHITTLAPALVDGISRQPRHLSQAEIAAEATALQAEMAREVAGFMLPSHAVSEAVAARALAMMHGAKRGVEGPQLVIVVDRNPAVERLYVMLAQSGGPENWRALGAVRVSTGQAGRKEYYITPVGVFEHGSEILDFRAQGTFNEHHVRGLGLAGMRVWDFGWQWALKGWHTDGAGGDIRLQMHATDPDLLERRLGRPASEGCVRVSSTMNKFMDHHGVLDADYEAEAAQTASLRALLPADRTPTKLAGRLLVVVDSSLPMDTPPTADQRPPGWLDPGRPAVLVQATPSPDKG